MKLYKTFTVDLILGKRCLFFHSFIKNWGGGASAPKAPPVSTPLHRTLPATPLIEVNNQRKTPVLQLKRSNSPLTLYLLNEQVVREKHVLGQTCHVLDN